MSTGEPDAPPSGEAELPRLYHVHCDESRQNADRFMVLGGIIADANYEQIICQTMAKYRQDQKMLAELKWGKVSGGKFNEYRAFVDYFFALNDTDKVHFHALIIDCSQLDHRTYNQGDREIGFYKFYYQLLLHSFGKRYCRAKPCRFSVYLDHRNSSYSLDTLKTVLNAGINKRYGVASQPFRSVEPRDSKTSELIQIADILLGAVGYQKNGYHLLAGAKKSKIDLANHIAQKAGLHDLTNSSQLGRHRFTIWNFKLSPRGGK